MKRLAAASMVAAALAFAGHANAATVTALSAGVMTTDLGGGLADFEGIPSATNPGNSAPPQGSFSDGGASFSGYGILMTGTTSGLYAAPYGDGTQYLTVQPNGSTETVTFGGSTSKLGLYWGSIDTYNSIVFYKNGSIVDTVTGTQAAAVIPGSANGDQSSDTSNRYLIISDILGGSFDEVVLTSTENSFELDNLAWGPVTNNGPGETPLPGALPLLASALGGAGLLRWKRRAKSTAV